MLKLKSRLENLKTAINQHCERVLCHRVIYAGLSLCHGSGCVITDKPELYAPMAALYAILIWRG